MDNKTAGEAEIYTIIAITDRSKGPRGASAFVVEKGTPGLRLGKKRTKWGYGPPQQLNLSSITAGSQRKTLSEKMGPGSSLRWKTLDSSRTGVGSQGVGVLRALTKRRLKYAKKRVQFGHLS